MDQYSFKDLNGAFAHPLAGVFSMYGQIGVGQLTVANTTERTAHLVAADGNVVVSFIDGDNGHVAVETQQTSDLHIFLLRWFNLIKTAAQNGDTSNWATATLSFRNIADGSTHTLKGVSPAKVPDKPYAASAQNITWMLMAADIQHTA